MWEYMAAVAATTFAVEDSWVGFYGFLRIRG
jgi:hypothetical protein